jgi:DtxR family transcriptional regulator, Mn-dependent transcriptional regulator
MNSLTEENYLKALYALHEKNRKEAFTNEIAEMMNIRPATVTDMLKKLAEKKLINYKKYKGVTLTIQGKKIALEIVRKHRLWEHFLVNKLNFKWDEVHEIAEQLEHINSSELIERLNKFLGFPDFDPHGDPIPDKQGKLPLKKSEILSVSKKGCNYTITGVAVQDTPFLKYLNKCGITLGDEIKVIEIAEFDHSMDISVNKKNSVHISHDVAKNILVKQL